MKHGALKLLAFAALSLSVQAQAENPLSPELQAFMSRPDEQKIYGAALLRDWDYAVDNCPSPAVKNLRLSIGIPPKFDAGGQPVSGEWRLIGQLEGCGKTRHLSILYGFGTDGKLVRAGMLPGTSVSNFRLQRDSLMYAAAAMGGLAPKDCKDVRILDTRFVAFEGPEAAKRPWTEEWTVRSCGVTGRVTMHYAPDATGTGITTRLSETRKGDQ